MYLKCYLSRNGAIRGNAVVLVSSIVAPTCHDNMVEHCAAYGTEIAAIVFDLIGCFAYNTLACDGAR